jgi:hypothetical protein
MTSKTPKEVDLSHKVDKEEFTRIIGNLLKMPPKKRVDSKLGTKKKQGKIIPPIPKTKDRSSQ